VLGKTYSAHELCGLDEIKDLFEMYIINRIKNPDNLLYKAQIAQCSTGIILHGAPGCGKTAITKTIAKQEGIQIVEVVLSEILNLWSGESEKRLTHIFRTAEDIAVRGQPVILFIDELDALGIARSLTFEAIEGSWSRDLRSTFRRLFNEVENIPNLAIIGATNCIWAVDEALKREGRLGERIYVPPPYAKTR
jgi:SpoVK/Ycf46/Vps4 family AAA+-type ATPase